MMWEDAGGRWQMHDQGSGWLMALLMLVVVVVVAVVVAVVALLRGWTPSSQAPTGGARAADPRAILQERFARGEIDEQDFRSRMRALDEHGG